MPNEPSLKWHRAITAFRWRFPAVQWGHETIVAFTGLFVCAALLFAWRRLFGALVTPLSPALLISSGFLAGISALGIQTLRRHSSNEKASSRGNLVLDIWLGASLLIFAAALSMPGTNAWGIGFFWLFIAAAELWIWLPRIEPWLRRPWSKENIFRKVRVDPAQSIAPHVEPAETAPPAVSTLLAPPAWPAEDISQQLTRSTAADGSDVLSGWLRLDFAPGQRMGNLHVAFCPPFASTPELSAVQLDGPEARIKVAQLLPYGARLDLKLLTISEAAAKVMVRFSARAARSEQDSFHV